MAVQLAITPRLDAQTAPTPLSKQPPFTNTLGMRFVRVPGTDALVSVWETRVRDYRDYVQARGVIWNKPDFAQTQDEPAVNVSWDDAKGFCEWLTVKERAEGRLRSNQNYDLPTDLEWSRAAGSGDEEGGTPKERDAKVRGVYPWGRSMPPRVGGKPMGNYADTTLKRAQSVRRTIDGYDDGVAWTARVGRYPANEFGIHDLGGNVWEWCADFYDGFGGKRVIRGACWYNYDPAFLLSSFRIAKDPASRTTMVGFRVVLRTGA